MRSRPGERIRYYLKLGKLSIMIPVSLTGFTGYFIFDPRLSSSIFLVTLAILLHAVAASVLNQIAEVEIDARMERTRSRPLPSGNITITGALIFFFCCFLAGSLILYLTGGLKAFLISLLTIFWYSGVYTYAKRITAFAVIPGALTGALPPLIGWVAAGGGIWDKPIVFLEFLFFTGQIPHFWLLILQFGEEYEGAGLPSLTSILGRPQIGRLTFTWTVTSIMAALFLCFFEIIGHPAISVLLVIASLYIVWKFSALARITEEKTSVRRYFGLLHAYFLLVMILLIADRIVR